MPDRHRHNYSTASTSQTRRAEQARGRRVDTAMRRVARRAARRPALPWWGCVGG